MWRSGGVCVSALPPDQSLTKVSPRIRALQDRLLDSLPADGAWECLSPPQREAIISIHRSRINGTPDGLCTLPNDAKWKNKKYKEFSQYGRSRSFEDKLESETDDSGVRLASGGTSTSNSQEDDSSDPGVKKSGRFTKSQTVDRLIKLEPKNIYDPKKKKTNGIGNVNKILSKQLAKYPNPNKVTLDCRNLASDKQRYRIDQNNPFENTSKHGRPDLISRKNILQKHSDPSPRLFSREPKNSISSEDYDSGVVLRQDFSSGCFDDRFADNSFESSNVGKLHSLSPNLKYRKYRSEFNSLDPPTPSRYIDSSRKGYMKYPNETNNNLIWEQNRVDIIHNAKNEPSKKIPNKNLCRSNLDSFDYRNHLNQDANKYSSNWNNIILNKDVPIKQNMMKSIETRPSRVSHGNLMNVSNNRNFDHINLSHVTHEKLNGKRYIRSKSLDRTYLDDSSDDDDDFERRRKVERKKRYAKANAEWDIARTTDSRQICPFPDDSIGRRSKSAWDLNNSSTKDQFDEFGNGFRSRKTILSKWKSEDIDLATSPKSPTSNQHNDDFNRSRWQRKSCDIELDYSDFERKARKDDTERNKLLRRSCDFELERNPFSHSKSNLNIAADNEFMHRRNAMRNRLHSGYPGKRPQVNRQFVSEVDNSLPNDYKYSRYENPNRRWSQPFENKATTHAKEYKNKKYGGFRGKLRIFKSILSL